ncbi:AI-2E family transporter [Limosilactobacillus caecicola]|uniref:AI-2E family transporter n=1 Tax=Limosilactobacillus caecicola TaxID=2941332 RepID=UPI0020403141|nr:AI-2E family transporter [Limosilactobacillus caecicola]
MENAWAKFTGNVHLHRTVVLVILVAILYLARGMMNTILLTFIFTYLIVHWVHLIQRWLPKLPTALIVVVTYLLLIWGIYYVVTDYMPMLINEIVKMVNSLIKFYQSDDMKWLMKYVNRYVSISTIIGQAKHGMTFAVNTLTRIGTLTIAFVMSLILSFFYTVELKQMNEFSHQFLDTKYLNWFFGDIYYFGKTFVNTFGVVLEAQFFIAICNTALTMICLSFMKMPQIFALGLMVFILSLIPVAGVIISLIPLSLVGYQVGGLRDVIYILIMIMVIHALEAYVLNPKFMSSRTELPIFYTFVVLLVAEHLWGTWGLIVGVPIFTFLLDIFGVKPVQKKHQLRPTKVEE